MRALRSSSGAPVSACTRHGCRLPPEGARAARSRMSRTVGSGTGVGRNARQLNREATASRTGMSSIRENEAEREHEHGRNKRTRIAPLHLKHSLLSVCIESCSSFARERRNALALIAPYGAAVLASHPRRQVGEAAVAVAHGFKLGKLLVAPV